MTSKPSRPSWHPMVAVLIGQLVHHEMRHLLKGDPRGVLPPPVGERRSNGLGILEAGDVVAGIAGEFAQRLFADIGQQRAVTAGAVEADKHLLVSPEAGLLG